MSCVYFIRHKTTKPIKIGYTEKETPLDRIATMETGSPFGIELLGFIETNNAKKLEIELHEKYDSFRTKGEWFDISEEEVKSILKEHSTININSLQILRAFLIKERLTPKEVTDIVKWHKQYYSHTIDEESLSSRKESFSLAVSKFYKEKLIPKNEQIDTKVIVAWLCKELNLSRAQVYRYMKKYRSEFFTTKKKGRASFLLLKESKE